MRHIDNQLGLLANIVNQINVGIFVINTRSELLLWNSYMESHSQTKAEDVLGVNLFKAFPELPRKWLEQKFHNAFTIKNTSFTSWTLRPYLFKFSDNHLLTSNTEFMRQNCSFSPLKGDSGEIEFVCVTIFDATEAYNYANTTNPTDSPTKQNKGSEQKNTTYLTIGYK